MGRSNRQTADYFPHYVGEKSRTKFILEKNWGNDGYAFWFKLLELLCAADGQYYDCWDKMGWEYLLAVTGVTAETAEAILNTLASMGKVDKELWESCRVIWVQSLLENLRQLYSKRTAAPTKPSVDNFPGRRAESPAQEPAAATEAEGTPPAVPEPAPEEPQRKVPPEIEELIAGALDMIADEDGYAFMGELGNLLIRQQPDFDPRNYGFSKLTQLIKSLDRFEVDVRQTSNPHTKHIFLRDKKRK